MVSYGDMPNEKHIILPKLYEWQQYTVDQFCNQCGTGKVVCCKSSRQRGKTYMCCAILIHYALSYAKTVSAIVEPTNAQARKVFKTIVDATYEAGLIKSKNETFLTIEFINGSTIMFKSAQIKDGLRGYTISGCLILDEAAYLTSDILELVLPWLNVHKAPMMLVSTPRIRDGVFYNYYKEGLDGKNNVVSVDWCDFDTSCMLSDEMMEMYRKTLTTNQFKSEILGEWLDDDGLVFSFLQENLIPSIVSQNYGKAYVGIDFGAGGGGDYTSVSAFDENGKMIFLDYWNDLTTFQQVERLAGDLVSLGPRIAHINAENNSIGSPLIDLLIRSLNEQKQSVLVAKINRWVTTNKSKSELVQQMQVALEQGKVKLFDDKMLLAQFGAYEAEYNPKTQVVTYNGAYGTHDDIVMSTMLAWDAYYKNATTGQYCIGFSRSNSLKI